MEKILLVDDSAFIQTQKARSINEIKTNMLPAVEEADIVIYLGRTEKIIKGVAKAKLYVIKAGM